MMDAKTAREITQELYPSSEWDKATFRERRLLIANAIRAAVAKAVAEEREACCCDMCFWCNEARDEDYVTSARELLGRGGEWYHILDNLDDPSPCDAQAIRARAAASAEENTA